MSDRPPTSDQFEATFLRRRRSAAASPLPGTDDELAQAALVAAGRRAENELAAMGAATVADLETAGALRAQVRSGELARDHLMRASEHMVELLAERHATDPEHHDLLVDAGDDALSRAIDRYDPESGLPFSSFARWWVERALRDLGAPLAPPTPSGSTGGTNAAATDPVLISALGHLNDDDCRIIELRLGLDDEDPRTVDETGEALRLSPDQVHRREQKALAKLRHPCTPGNLTHLREI